MKIRLNVKMTAAFTCISVCIILVVFILTRLLISESFQVYLSGRQDNRIIKIKDELEEAYVSSNAWKEQNVESIGIVALEQGLIIILRDEQGNIVWDASAHNSGMCSSMINHMAENMKSHYPNVDGGYTTQEVSIYSSVGLVGVLEVGYYGPFYLSDDESLFFSAINRALLLSTLIALVLSIIGGLFFANRMSRPLLRLVDVSRKLSKGEYNHSQKLKSTTSEIQELIETVYDLSHILSEQQGLRKRLTQDMAHELKTPMSALQCHMEAMMDGIWEPNYDRLKSCHDEIIRVNTMISKLDDLERYEDGSQKLTYQEIDLNELVHSVITNVESAFWEKGVFLRQAGEPGIVWTDKDKLTQILLNLLSNALKYTPVNGAVEVNVQNIGQHFIVRIMDDGIGISKQDLPLIFERFYRTDQSRARKTGGAGIGLAIVRALVSAMNGSISVTSVPNKKTEFSIILPSKPQKKHK